jgi:hypothetical protein
VDERTAEVNQKVEVFTSNSGWQPAVIFSAKAVGAFVLLGSSYDFFLWSHFRDAS